VTSVVVRITSVSRTIRGKAEGIEAVKDETHMFQDHVFSYWFIVIVMLSLAALPYPVCTCASSIQNTSQI
jgi:hypothetical protein